MSYDSASSYVDASQGQDEDTFNHCDRRLSRAAREIMRREVFPILRHAMMESDPSIPQQQQQQLQPREGEARSSLFSLAPEELWETLSWTVSSQTTTAITTATCRLLDPEADVLAHQERNALQGFRKAPSPLIVPLSRFNNNNNNNNMQAERYKCGLCGKSFHTRYYLDQHFDRQHPITAIHHHMDHHNNSHEMICPATDWCPFLGGETACRTMAMELEPYYGPGSGEHTGRNSMSVLERRNDPPPPEPPCDPRVLQEVREKCRYVMETCIGVLPNKSSSNNNNNNESRIMEDDSGTHEASLQQDLVSHVCHQFTCDQRLHTLAGHTVRHMHHWKDLWSQHHDFSKDGFWAILLFFVLGIVYGSYYAFLRPKPHAGISHTNRLLGASHRISSRTQSKLTRRHTITHRSERKPKLH